MNYRAMSDTELKNRYRLVMQELGAAITRDDPMDKRTVLVMDGLAITLMLDERAQVRRNIKGR